MKLSIWDMLVTWPPHHGVKKKATSILVGFVFFLGASILVLTVSSFIFPSVFASITNPLLKENPDRYYLKFGFTNWHQSPSSTTAATPAKNSTVKNNSENSIVDLAGKLVYTGEEFVPSSTNFSSDCDIFEGEWVMAEDPKQYYAPGSCPYLETRSFDCHGSGRPDDEYLKWHWKWQSHPRNAGCKDNIP
ncbi:hypothetical protein MKW98_009962, partial [Papaver atlanticum]